LKTITNKTNTIFEEQQDNLESTTPTTLTDSNIFDDLSSSSIAHEIHENNIREHLKNDVTATINSSRYPPTLANDSHQSSATVDWPQQNLRVEIHHPNLPPNSPSATQRTPVPVKKKNTHFSNSQQLQTKKIQTDISTHRTASGISSAITFTFEHL